MSEPIDQKRGRAIYSAAERFNTLSAFFAALFGLIVGICGTLTAGKIWLRGIVRQEVNYQQEPRIAFYQALSHFAAEREDDGFRALDESLALYEARRGEVTPEEYENMLHNYIYYLGRARRPERQQNRLERLVQKFREAGVTLSLADQMAIAWFRLNSGQLSDAHREFDKVARIAASEHQPYTEAAAYNGLFFCSLAEGNVTEASKFYHLAAEHDPYTYSHWIINEHDPPHVRYATLYDPFDEAAKLYYKQTNSSGSIRKKP